jgi:hypothetical protein
VFVFDEEDAHGASIAGNDEGWMKAILPRTNYGRKENQGIFLKIP